MKREHRGAARIIGLGAAACVACCAGPIVAFVGGVALFGAIGAKFIGIAALLVASGVIVAMLALRRRRSGCESRTAPVPMDVPVRRRTADRI
jgi:hypothetical protein